MTLLILSTDCLPLKYVIDKKQKDISNMAEGRGFEPPKLITCRISSAVPSTARPPLHF